VASTRLRKWLKKTNPETVSRAYSLSREIQEELGGQEQVKHHLALMKAKKLVDENVDNAYLKMPYLSAAERLFRISRNYLGESATKMATAEVSLWVKRGLDLMLLVGIARIFSLQVLVEELMPATVVAKFQVIPHEGTVNIDSTDTPYTVVMFTSDKVQEVEGRIEVESLGSPDRIQIIEYEKLSPDGPWTVLNKGEEDVSLLPTQPGSPPTIRLPRKVEKYGYWVVVVALDLAPRTIRYNFQRILYE
jgi:hypothetical protein